MKIGDLVWHVEDIKIDIPVPGLVVAFDAYDFAVVRFTDKDVPERHLKSELAHSPCLEEDENIMGNP